MQFQLTNKNIRLRYALDARAAKAHKRRFGLRELGQAFGVGNRAAYTWVTKVKALQHLPAGQKRERVLAWINDGALEAWVKEAGKP
jgi:hypothetical protein